MKEMIIVPAYEKEYINGKTTLKIDIAIPKETASHPQYLFNKKRDGTKIIVSQSSQNNSEIKCEISLSDWNEVRSLVNLTNKNSRVNTLSYTIDSSTMKYEEIRRTTEAVYCAIRILAGKQLSFEQQVACQRLLTYDCNNSPSCVKERVVAYMEGLTIAQSELHSAGCAKVRALFFASNLSGFALFYSPLYTQDERFAPWELQLSYRKPGSSKPRKGLPITMKQENLAMIINKVDNAIYSIMQRSFSEGK